jgi:nucleotide-binding universal stress UspA family protein
MAIAKSGAVLICADMSSYAPAVVREGLRRAALEQFPAIVLHVIDDRFPYPDLFAVNKPDVDYFLTLREAALVRLREWTASAAGPRPEIIVARGKPSAVILEVAGERSPSLVVLGAHGLTGSRHPRTLGATAERVARASPASVLIVVHPTE